MHWTLKCGAAVLGCAACVAGLSPRAVAPVEAQVFVPVTPLDPCSGMAVRSLRSLSAPTPAQQAAREAKTDVLDHDNPYGHLDALWADRASRTRSPRANATPPRGLDVGDIAVMQDAGGDLMTLVNLLDLGDTGLRLTPNAVGGYDVIPIAYGFREPFGTALVLGDDATTSVALPFAFPFFGRTHSAVFVNSDGNLTFGYGDMASTERSVSRLVTGAPRIAPLFADLDPSAGGTVLTSGDEGAFSATWCGVPAWREADSLDPIELATMQVTVYPDGVIDLQISALTTIRDAVVGLSPGQTQEFLPVDLSAPTGTPGASHALGERFVSTAELNLVGVSRRFFATHPDQYDGLSIFTDRELLTDAFAFEIATKNQIRGIGVPVYNAASEFGSAGRLESLCNMDAIAKYPDDPHARVLGEFSAAAVMAHEFGHRWLAFARIRDAMGLTSSGELLGRQGAHWSFFLDTDGSVMEGNEIEDEGDGSFRTLAPGRRYSSLDLYLMGLIDQSEVPPFFLVQEPTGMFQVRTNESFPRSNVRFQGVRRDVTIDDVIGVMGPRVPSSALAPRTLRHGFVYVVGPGGVANVTAVQKLERFRLALEQFVSEATGSRLAVDTSLRVDQPIAMGQ